MATMHREGPTLPQGADLRLEQVRRTHRARDGATTVALDGVDLAVPAGEVVALVGPSGSGKSTLLHLLGGLDAADEGTVSVDGVALGGLGRRALVAHRRRTGFVFQQFHLLAALTAQDNVLAPLVPTGVGRAERARAHELLEAVGLADRADALPSALSGGQQQRVAIARALVGRPTLLLADEPTGNLDSRAGEEVLELLLGARATQGATVVVATHDATVAARCDRTVRLRDGRVVEDVDLRGPRDVEARLRRPSAG